MTLNRVLPDDPLGFIQRCVAERKILWTYHVNMRLKGRFISRQAIIESYLYYEIIEQYPEDKYLPSYLLRSEYRKDIFHILYAADVEGDNVRIVTATAQTLRNGMKASEIGGNPHEMPYVRI